MRFYSEKNLEDFRKAREKEQRKSLFLRSKEYITFKLLKVIEITANAVITIAMKVLKYTKKTKDN